METIVFNDDNLSGNDIQDTILKSRAVIINDNQEVLLSKCSGFYLFPGGKLSENESFTEGLVREVKEETGITLDKAPDKPFLRIKHIIKHYPKRETNNIFGSRQNITDYYLILADQNIDESAINLTEYEKEAGFKTIKIKIDKIPSLIKANSKSDIRAKCFAKEISAVLSELKPLLNKKSLSDII